MLFLSSTDAVAHDGDALHYSLTKTALLGLSRGLAQLAGGSGVTVNAVLPGVTGVEWVEEMVRGMRTDPDQSLQEVGDAAVKARYPTSIDGRVHRVEEVANLMVWLCSEQSSAVTGSALHADGGIVQSIV